MHKIMKLLKGKQSGQALVLALAMLGVGSLMIAPMLSFMGTGLNAGVVAEDKMDELYACDAGVQDAIWNINNLDEPGAIPYTELDGEDDVTGDPIEEVYDYALEGRPLPHVNGMDVHVRIRLLYMIEGFGVYQVHSWIGDDGFNDADTRIDAIITTTWLDYGYLLDNPITSPGEVNLQPGSDVTGGDIVCPEEPEGQGDYETWDGDTEVFWPTAVEIIDYYLRQMDTDNPYPNPEDDFDLDGVDATLGPEYIDYTEGTFDFGNSDNTEATLTLTGDIYLTGQTDIGGSKDWTLDLNGYTIFVEDSTTGGGDALNIDNSCNLIGNGCIVAIGDIYFSPKTGTNPDDFIFVCSIDGLINFNPHGDFEGAVAGNVEVNLQPGCEVNWHDWPDVEPPPDGDGIPDLNWPGGSGGEGMIWGIQTWLYNETYEIP